MTITARLFPLVTLFLVLAAPQSAWADVGFRVGPRVGFEFHEDDPIVGADVRLSFSLSPLTINPIFDYYFDEEKTLFQLGLNALYYLPLQTRVLNPYAGAGVGVIAFSFREGVPNTDDNGSRVGLNLIGGVCFDLPVLTPFVQAMVSIGEIDLVTIGGGFLFDFGGGRRSWDTCGRRRTRGADAGTAQ